MLYISIHQAGKIDWTLWPAIVETAAKEATVDDCVKESVQAE